MANNLVNGEMLNYFLGKLDGKYMSNQQGYTTKECIVELRDDSNSDNYYVAQNGYFKFCNIKIPNNTYTEILIKVTSLGSLGSTYSSYNRPLDATKNLVNIYDIDSLLLYNNNGVISFDTYVSLYSYNERDTSSSNTLYSNLSYLYSTLSDGSIDLYIARGGIGSSDSYTRYKLLIQLSIESEYSEYITLFDSSEPELYYYDYYNNDKYAYFKFNTAQDTPI